MYNTILTDSIIDQINIIRCKIQSKCKLGLNNDAVRAQDLVCRIMNIVYGYSLYNLNSDTSNFPGIDLGDDENSLGIQVTSDNSSKKIRKTLQICEANECCHKYSHLIVFVLTWKQKTYSVGEVPSRFVFNPKNDIIDFDDLYRAIEMLDMNRKSQVASIVSNELPFILQLEQQSWKNGVDERNYYSFIANQISNGDVFIDPYSIQIYIEVDETVSSLSAEIARTCSAKLCDEYEHGFHYSYKFTLLGLSTIRQLKQAIAKYYDLTLFLAITILQDTKEIAQLDRTIGLWYFCFAFLLKEKDDEIVNMFFDNTYIDYPGKQEFINRLRLLVDQFPI